MFVIRYSELSGGVAQLVRAPACHAGGREFESRPYRKTKALKIKNGFQRFLFLTSLSSSVKHNPINLSISSQYKPLYIEIIPKLSTYNQAIRKICLILPGRRGFS